MRRIFLVSILIAILLLMLGTTILAVEERNTLETETTSELIQMKEETKTKGVDPPHVHVFPELHLHAPCRTHASRIGRTAPTRIRSCA